MFVDYTVFADPAMAENVPILNGLGTNKYRIVTPWSYLYGSDCSGATDIEFTLDENYDMTLVTDGSANGIVSQFTHASEGSFVFCWPEKYASRFTIVRQENIYQASMFGIWNGDGYYNGFSFAFQWTDGWPGAK